MNEKTVTLAELKTSVKSALNGVSTQLGKFSSCRTISAVVSADSTEPRKAGYTVNCTGGKSFPGLYLMKGVCRPNVIQGLGQGREVKKDGTVIERRQMLNVGILDGSTADEKLSKDLVWPRGEKGEKGKKEKTDGITDEGVVGKKESWFKKNFKYQKPSVTATGVKGSVTGVSIGATGVSFSLSLVDNLLDGVDLKFRASMLSSSLHAKTLKGNETNFKLFLKGLRPLNVTKEVINAESQGGVEAEN